MSTTSKSQTHNLSKLNARKSIGRDISEGDSPIKEKSAHNKKKRHLNNRSKAESVRNKSLSLLLENYSYKSQDTNTGQSPDTSDWDVNLDTLLTSDTIDTDEFEAELRRQKRKNKKEKKHKRSKKLKKRKRKRARSYSSVESLLDNDKKIEFESSGDYLPKDVRHSKLKNIDAYGDSGVKTDKTVSNNVQSPRRSPAPTRANSHNSYYSGSTSLSVAVDNSGALTSAPVAAITSITVTSSVTTTVASGSGSNTGPLPVSTENFGAKRHAGTLVSHRRRTKHVYSPHTPPLNTNSIINNRSSSCDIRGSSRSTSSPNRRRLSRHYRKYPHHYRSMSGSDTASSIYYRNKHKLARVDRKRKDAERYYCHASTPPHKKQRVQDVRNFSTFSASNHDRANNISSRRYSKHNDVYYKESYSKRFHR